MTEEEKDILILKILERSQCLTEEELTIILSDTELLDIYNTSLKVKDAFRPEVDPAKEWEMMKTRIKATQKENVSTSLPESEVVRNSLWTGSWLIILKSRAAAAVVILIVVAAIASALLWNPEPIQQESTYNGIAQNPNNLNSNKDLVNISDTETVAGGSGESAKADKFEKDNSENSQNDKLVESVQAQTSISNMHSGTSKGERPSVESSTHNSQNLENSVENPSVENNSEELFLPPFQQEVDIIIDNNPANLSFAYTEENFDDIELGQLDGLLPEDWDIEQCLKLQQARIDNDLALARAQSMKREYEIYRESLLIEYQITNPDSDEATLEALRTYLDDIYGNLYSAIP